MTTYYQEPRPAQKIPTRKQLEAAARRQAALEATDDGENDYAFEEGDEYYQTRLPTSTRRYQVSPEEVYQSGNTRYHVRYVDIPKRKSRQQLPPARERYTEEVAAVPTAIQHKRSIHPMLYLGVGMIAMLALFLLLSSAATWIQTTKDDLTYGRPRTFHIDVVVGHNDTSSNPSHFIALNLNRNIIIIELPGGDSSKAKIYTVTTLYGDGQDLTPVTISFKDVNGDGLLDMEIHIQDQTIVLINDQGSFRPQKPGEQVHL